MEDNPLTFSKRHGYLPLDIEITIREDAPPFLRHFVIRQAELQNIPIKSLLNIVCDVLHENPQGNWGYDYIDQEIREHINYCEWYKVYDIAEAIYAYLESSGFDKHIIYANSFNELCREKGVGWHFQIPEGRIVARSTAVQEKILNLSLDVLKQSHPTAKNELQEALNDISRRPKSDLTGAVHHAVAALECIARKITGDESSTLGKIVSKFPALFPKPLDTAVAKIWGYASEKARHVKEGNEPSFQEALMIIGFTASLVSFLNRTEF